MSDSEEDNPFIVIRGDYCYELPEPEEDDYEVIIVSLLAF